MATWRVGCCISSHGFGHAARTLAVMESLAGLADVHFTVVSRVPEWFFRSSCPGPMDYASLQTDVGLVQHSSLHEDLPATIAELAGFYPLRAEYLAELAGFFAGCDLLLCDIAPAGIAAASRCGIPSVLVENFTWDWIYEGYLPRCQELAPFCRELARLFARADYRIRTMPCCGPAQGDLLAGPVARRFRLPREEIHRRLEIPAGCRMTLITLGGGNPGNVPLELPAVEDTVFVLPGDGWKHTGGRHVRRPADGGDFFHPDLVAASDAVIGKVGYSTLAEVYRAGVPFGYIGRKSFRESGPLEDFIRREMAGLEIAEEELAGGRLAGPLSALYDRKVPPARFGDGAGQCAAFIHSLLRRDRRGA